MGRKSDLDSTMLPDDLQHEQFLMVQARALGVDWRPGAEFVRQALLVCADLALLDPAGAGVAARRLTRVEPLAWARSAKGDPGLLVLMYAPQGDLPEEDRVHLESVRRLFHDLEGADLEVYLIRDDGEVSTLS